MRSRTTDELTQKLAPSFAKYNGKDALVVVIKDRKKGHAFSKLEHQPGVTTLPFDQLCPPAPTSAAANSPVDQDALANSANGTNGAQDQYSIKETEAITKIQHLWRSVSLKIKNRRSYVSTPACRALAHFFNLGAQCADTVNSGDRKAMRKLLLSRGVELSLRLDTAKELLSTSQEATMACLENVEIAQGVYQSLDEILCHNRDAEALLDKAEEKMLDQCLVGLVNPGVLSLLQEALEAVEEIVIKVEQSMLETRKMIDAVSVSKDSGTRLR